MKTYGRPRDYVEIQRKYNSFHTNGEMENEDDWANARPVAEKLLQHCQPKRLLVLGCRTGAECELYEEAIFPQPLVVGVDLVPEFVALACTRVPTLCRNIHDLGLPENSFDAVVCRGTLEHCYHPKVVLEEIFYVCETGGFAYVTADLEKDRGAFRSHFSFSDDENEWLELCQEVGFAVVEKGIEKGMRHNGLWVLLSTNV